MKTVTDIAQEMLDRYGFFVVCQSRPVKLGISRIGLIDSRHQRPGLIAAGSFVIIGPASREDYRLQCELAGMPDENLGHYMYRAVAE